MGVPSQIVKSKPAPLFAQCESARGGSPPPQEPACEVVRASVARARPSDGAALMHAGARGRARMGVWLATAIYRPWHLHGEHLGIYVPRNCATTAAAGNRV